MSIDAAYKPIEYIFKSRGLIARNIYDQAPEYTYLDMLNCLEREENSMSSRFGTQIINRDPAGTGVNNYYFASPVTTLSRLVFQGNSYRYAGLGNGTLQRRAGDAQGAYTQIYSGLSGNRFQTVVTNCFQSSQSYLFIYDSSASIKDMGTGTPQLTGIDPPPYTANAVPYSPLLTLIDNFATGNAYTTSGFSVAWAYTPITTITVNGGQIVTDFPEFFNVGTGHTVAGGSVTATQVGLGSVAQHTIFSGFASVPITYGEVVTVSVPDTSDIAVVTGTADGVSYVVANMNFYYSIDSGVTWTPFGADSGTGLFNPGTYALINSGRTWTFPVSGLANLNQLQIKVEVISGSYGNGTLDLATTATIGTITATASAAGEFGAICNGMLSILANNALTTVPIVSVASSGLSGSTYQTLLVTTSTNHGLTTGNEVSIYATSNEIVDGFYPVTVTGPTTFTVPFVSAVALSAQGGNVFTYAVGSPNECILTNEYDSPYPTQLSAWGFYQQVPTSTASFPVGAWQGTVATNSSATVGVTKNFNLSLNSQVTDDDLIVLVLSVNNPANISNIRLQFDVNGSGYTSTYYYKDITPAYYQGNIANQVSAYQATENQILADTLGLITGQAPNSTSAQLQPGNISTGGGAWNAIYLRRGDFLPIGNAGQSGLDWTNITGWQLVITTSTTAVTGDGSAMVSANGLYLQWGYGPSSFGGVGYDYRYTYYNANTGTESNGSPIQNFSELFGYLSSLQAPFFLRQAVQVTGYYSSDSQVTHIRVYRRGGIYGDNWRQIDQIPNITGNSQFIYKDTIADAALAQANTLVLDNDPPVTSSLVNPISTTLSVATTGGGSTIYSTYSPQVITVADATATFVAEQVVLVGNANNLEICRVVTGGAGQFTATVRLQHNAGEPVICYSVPRQKCDLCALAYGQVWLAGDSNNPNYLYYSKPGYPESFGPQNYIPVSASDDPIMAVINWRGTLVVATLKTWYIIIGGAKPYAQPTGAAHGLIAKNGWCLVESAIWFRAADGLRQFTGADGAYQTLLVEWIYRNNPLCIPPQAYLPSANQDVLAYYNNCVYDSYVSLSNGAAGARYRMVYDRIYQRFRYDDMPATAMLWEQDTNAFLVGKEISAGNYAVVQDWVGDYDDGGWNAGALVETPINLAIQLPYFDLKRPHNPKQWNMVELDVDTKGQTITTELLFEDGSTTLNLSNASTTSRQKVELWVNNGKGEQAYRASVRHTIAVTKAPIIFQDNIYAALLAEYTGSYDTYWLKFGTDKDKFVKQGWFDYTSDVVLTVSLFADNNDTAYFSFTLPALTTPSRAIQRVRFGSIYPGTTAFTMRTWRMIVKTPADAGTNKFQFWANPRIEFKTVDKGSSYQVKELEV